MEQAGYGQKPANGAPMNGRSPITVKVDNLIRSKLRVSNPNDPSEIADGLQRFYKGAAELTRLEESGLPFYQVQTVQTPRATSPGPSGFELDQAKADVAKDLYWLVNEQLLKDINPELRGWQSAIDNIIADGAEAAPLALDPRMRDRGFQARRLLGDYARVARFVGTLTPSLNDNFRALARSLDEVGSVLMVLMGDAIANVGFSGGRFLLQAQASDLQDRRDAVLCGLRNLVGSTQMAFGSGEDDWPRGLHAYRQFIDRLDSTGNSDLRALFQEANLAKLMDDLIARVNVMSSDGLRALGSTAVLQVQPMRRLIQLGQSLVNPPAAQLAAFLDALLLFVEAFKYASSGSRLIQIARPAIVNYGLYGLSTSDDTTLRMINLVIARGTLAVQLDCFLAGKSSNDDIRNQIILDKLLYDIDRSIDALSLSDGNGDAEARASAHGLILETLLLASSVMQPILERDAPEIAAKFNNALFNSGQPNEIGPVFNGQPEVDATRAQLRNRDLGKALIDATRVLLPGSDWESTYIRSEVSESSLNIGGVRRFFVEGLPTRPTYPPASAPDNLKLTTVSQELCMQEDAEKQWKNLLLTLAPSCFRTEQFLDDTTTLVEAARAARSLELCPKDLDVSIPKDKSTSLSDGFPPKVKEGTQEAIPVTVNWGELGELLRRLPPPRPPRK